jgi:hypothetical protein
VEEDLQQGDAVRVQDPLEFVDLPVPLAPDLLRHELVHPHHQHVLVVRPVEDPDHAERRDRPVDPPQEVVGPLLRAGNLEGGDGAPGGIQSAHDVADHPVLPARVDGLEHDQHGARAVGVEPVLEIGEALEVLLQAGMGLRLVPEGAGVVGIDAVECEALAGLDPDGVGSRHSKLLSPRGRSGAGSRPAPSPRAAR